MIRPPRGRPFYDEDEMLGQAIDGRLGAVPPPNLRASLGAVGQQGGASPAGEDIINLPPGPNWGNYHPGYQNQDGSPRRPGNNQPLPSLPVTSKTPGATRPPGSVVNTGPNTTNPGGTPGLEMGTGTGFGAASPTTGAGRRGWAGQSGTGLNLDMPTGAGNYGRLEGFNTERAFGGGDPNSVKDAFARWVTGLGFDPTTASKEQIEAIIRQNLDSARQFGLNILDVNGENILIETAERGPEWVDTVRGAGGGDAAWQWGAADTAGGTTGGATPPGVSMERSDGPGQGNYHGDLGGLGDLGAQMGDSETIRRILAEIQRLIDPSQADALLGGAIEERFR